MSTTIDEIRAWLEDGKTRGATHMIVATDTFDWSDYPVYVAAGEDVRKKVAGEEKVMEVYSFALDLEEQLRERRAFHPD